MFVRKETYNNLKKENEYLKECLDNLGKKMNNLEDIVKKNTTPVVSSDLQKSILQQHMKHAVAKGKYLQILLLAYRAYKYWYIQLINCLKENNLDNLYVQLKNGKMVKVYKQRHVLDSLISHLLKNGFLHSNLTENEIDTIFNSVDDIFANRGIMPNNEII